MRWLSANLGPLDIYLPGRLASDELPDVVLLQGFFLGHRAMEWHAERLRAAGLRVAIPRLGGLFGLLQTRRVEGAARALVAYLDTLPAGHRPMLVGHSFGGIIARYALQVLGASERVRGLITLGTPHQGTPMAFAGMAVGAGLVSFVPWQLRPQSAVLRDLNARDWVALPLTAIVSAVDLVCLAPRGEPPYVGHALVDVRELEGLGHTELLWRETALELVATLCLNQR